MEKYNEVAKHVRKSNITKYIMNMDSTLEMEDIINEVYIKIYNKNFQYIHNCIKQTLLNLYNKYKIRQSRKCNICVDEIDIEDIYTIENKLYVNIMLDIIKQQDETIYNCLYYYFVNNMTYKEISKIVGISFNSVKNKIDKGLEIISNM